MHYAYIWSTHELLFLLYAGLQAGLRVAPIKYTTTWTPITPYVMAVGGVFDFVFDCV
jgi:hypothetical protein